MIERRMEHLRPNDYRRLRDEAPIAYLPWGAHEWHGLHNVLGVDSLKAHALALRLADRTGGIVLPPVYCGYATMQRHCQTCTLEFPVELVEQMARHYFLQLRLDGFRVIVAVLGHFGHDHLRAIQRVGQRVAEDWPKQLRIIIEPEYVWTQPEFGADHAGAVETSYMMHLFPGSVDLAALPPVAGQPKLDFRRDGIGGEDPRTAASAERGKQQVDLLLSRAAPRILEALAEVQGR